MYYVLRKSLERGTLLTYCCTCSYEYCLSRVSYLARALQVLLLPPTNPHQGKASTYEYEVRGARDVVSNSGYLSIGGIMSLSYEYSIPRDKITQG